VSSAAVPTIQRSLPRASADARLSPDPSLTLTSGPVGRDVKK